MTQTIEEIDLEFETFLKGINPSIKKENIIKAYKFSKEAHKNQKRISGEPYISHPLNVAKIVSELGLDEVSIIAALLHDVVEDTEQNLSEIDKVFGEEIKILVEGLTKIQHGENKVNKNIEALRKILLASAKDIRILIIKLCDRLHNMKTLNELPEEKRIRISKETLLIYAPIAQKVGIYSLKWELEDTSFKYINPEMYQFIKFKLKLKREEREEIVKKAVEEIKDFLTINGFTKDLIVLGRPKNFYSIYKKIKNKAKSFEDIHDLYAIRIITKSVGDCYSILGFLHENFQAFPNRLKDYIATPKNNGYQSIHTVIYSRSIKTPVEIQIRTEEMNKLAEFGVAAHWKYKNLKEDKKFEKKIAWLREVLQWEKEHKDDQEFLNLLKFDFFEDEIFVFTPKNDLFTLPEDATVLDFAYAVHTEIGNHAQKAKVNGLNCNIDKILKSGDIVEIQTNKNIKPSEKWLKIIKTSKARLKIKDALNLKHKKNPTVNNQKEEIPFETLKDKIQLLDDFKKIRNAGCCNIEYGDQIVGIIPNKKEIVIHNASCENAKYTLSKKIPLKWLKETNKDTTLEIILKDRFGILIDMLNIFSEFNLNISQLNSQVQKDGRVKMNITTLDGPFIDKLVEKLRNIEYVESVKINRSILDKFKF